MNYQDKIEQLKKLTVAKDADFYVAANYFFDISDGTSLMDDGTKLEENHDFFKALLEPVAKHYGKEVIVKEVYLVQLKAAGFIHGIAVLSNGLSPGLYFFESIKTGLAFVVVPGVTNEFFRITAFEVENPKLAPLGNVIVPDGISKSYH